LIGNLAGLLATLKGLPSAYDKDLQEDKEPVFDSYDTLVAIIPPFAGLVGSLHLHPKRMMEGIDAALFATDLAEYLVEKGIPFRQADSLVGEVVRRAEEQGVALSDLPLSTLQTVDERFGEDVARVFDLRAAHERRAVPGGTSPRAVASQLELARTSLS
jgi:argininosuccinate lyase